jgi:hypothetical protein
MAGYVEQFPVGARVRIASRDRLETFKETWRFHHPLGADQLSFADREATVREVTFYHGGDVLYSLQEVPGIWHEQCLSAAVLG